MILHLDSTQLLDKQPLHIQAYSVYPSAYYPDVMKVNNINVQVKLISNYNQVSNPTPRKLLNWYNRPVKRFSTNLIQNIWHY